MVCCKTCNFKQSADSQHTVSRKTGQGITELHGLCSWQSDASAVVWDVVVVEEMEVAGAKMLSNCDIEARLLGKSAVSFTDDEQKEADVRRFTCKQVGQLPGFEMPRGSAPAETECMPMRSQWCLLSACCRKYNLPDNLQNPRLDHVVPLLPLRDEQDTRTSCCSRSSILQVSDLKDHFHVWQQPDTLIGRQCQETIIIHDTVHALNPVHQNHLLVDILIHT